MLRLQLRGVSLRSGVYSFIKAHWVAWSHGSSSKDTSLFLRRSMYTYSTLTLDESAHIVTCSIIVNHNRSRHVGHGLDCICKRVQNAQCLSHCNRTELHARLPSKQTPLASQMLRQTGTCRADRNGASGLQFVDSLGQLDHGLTTAWHRLASLDGAQPAH